MNDNLSIQQLTREIETLTETMDRAELLELIQGLAGRQPIRKRSEFLKELRSVYGQADDPCAVAETASDDDSPAGLESILEEAAERQTLIENGEYHELEDYEEEGWHYYDDEGPDALTEDHKSHLKEIREKADFAWLDGHRVRALELYRALIEFAGNAWEEGIFLDGLFDLSLGESYCSCICETTNPEAQASALVDALVFCASCLRFSGRYLEDDGLVSLRKLATPMTDPLALQAVLEQQQSPLARHYILELLLICKDDDAAWACVQQQSTDLPALLGFYLHEMDEAEQWERLSVAARFGLRQPIADKCGYMAELLVKAGQKTDSPMDVADGLRADFKRYPNVGKVIRLHDLLKDQHPYAHELETYRSMSAGKPFEGSHSLVLILLGQFEEALEAVAPHTKEVGWSVERTFPIVVGASLAYLCRRQPKLPSNVYNLLNRYLNPSAYDPFSGGDSREKTNAFLQSIRRALPEQIDEQTETFIWGWTRKLLVKRAETIVGNKYRGAYDRAAEGIAAWAECARIHSRQDDADRIIEQLRSAFPRHSAFKKELAAAVARFSGPCE